MNIQAHLDSSCGRRASTGLLKQMIYLKSWLVVWMICQTCPIVFLSCSLHYILFRVHMLVLQSKHWVHAYTLVSFFRHCWCLLSVLKLAQSEKPEGDFFDAGKLHCGQGRHNAQSLPARTPNLTRTNSYRSTIVAGQGQPLQAREALTTARDAYQHSSYRLGTQLPL